MSIWLINLVFAIDNHAQFSPSVPIYGKTIYHPMAWITNPAELGRDRRLSAAIFTQSHIQIPEIRQYLITVHSALESGGIGFEGSTYGNGTYLEWMAGLGYGLNLGKSSVGIKMNYTGITIPGFASQQRYLLKIGSVFNLNPTLKAGAIVAARKYPVHSTILRNPLFIDYEFGLGYEPSSKLLISVQSGLIDTHFHNKAMLSYYFHSSFSALLSLETTAAVLGITAGWHLKNFSVQVSCRIEPHAGLTPGIILYYQPESPDLD